MSGTKDPLMEQLDSQALNLLSGKTKVRTFVCKVCDFDCAIAFQSSKENVCSDCNKEDCEECHGSGRIFGGYDDITDESTYQTCRGCGGKGKSQNASS